jgi:hypothetical protein
MRVRLLSGDLEVDGDTPEDVQAAVAQHMGVPPHRVRLMPFEETYACVIMPPQLPEWLDVERLMAEPRFSSNPNAIPLLAEHPERINYQYLSANPHPTALEWLVASGRIDWYRLSSNPAALDLLGGSDVVVDQLCRNPNPDAIHLIAPYTALPTFRWNELALNPNAVEMLDQYLLLYPERADWTAATIQDPGVISMRRLASNTAAAPIFARLGRTTLELFGNPNALDLVRDDPRIAEGDEAVWMLLCRNPSALPIIERYPQHIHWPSLSTNPSAIYILQANYFRVDARRMSSNPNAIELLERSFSEPWTNEPWPRQRNAPDHMALSALRSPDLMTFLKRRPGYIYWPELAANPFVFQ